MSAIPHLAMHHNPDLLKNSQPNYHHSVMAGPLMSYYIKRFDTNGIMDDVVLSKNVSEEHVKKLEELANKLNSHEFAVRLGGLRKLEAYGWANLHSTLLLQKYEQASHSGRPEFKGCPPTIRWAPPMDERTKSLLHPNDVKVIINSSEDAKRFLEGDWKVERPEIRNDREHSKPVTVTARIDRKTWAEVASEMTEDDKEMREACEKAFRRAAANMHEQMLRRAMGGPVSMQCHPGVVTANDIAKALGEHGRHINLEELSEEDKQALANHLAHTDNPVELIKKWVMETGSSVAVDSFGRALATMQGTCNDLTEQVGQPVHDPIEADSNVVTGEEECDGYKAFDILKGMCK